MSTETKTLLTAAELAALVGRTGLYCAKGTMEIEIVVQDARENYGRLDLRIAPVAGKGAAWISSDFIKLNKQDKGNQ